MLHARSLARLSPLLYAGIVLLCACPASAPSADATQRNAAPTAAPTEPTLPVEPAAPAPAPAPTMLVEPSPDPAAPPDLPPALAAPGVRPVVQSLARALEAVAAGDPDAMGRVMLTEARWFPPGSPQESVGNGSELRRAMSPWGTPELGVDLRRVIDLGGSPWFAQVSIASREQPTMRYELALMIETQGDRISAVHQFGDPLGPVRIGPNEQEPLDLGPTTVVLEGGPPTLAHVDATKRLAEALQARNDDAVRALLAEDVVLHDVIARRTRRGRDGYLAGFAETLGEAGHLVVDEHYAGERMVVMVGAIDSRGTQADAEAMEHGFADIHRLADGKVLETWHYVNRRGRARRPRLRP